MRGRSAREVLVMRHPETVANAAGLYLGRSDSPFTDLGRQQADYLGEVMRAYAPARVVASPLARTRDTARAAGAGEVELLDDLIEIDFGQAEGLTYSEIHARGIELSFGGDGPVAPGGESAAGFDARVRRAAANIASGPAKTAVVTHGGVLRRLLIVWLDLRPEDGWSFQLGNAVIARIGLYEGGAVLEDLIAYPGCGPRQ